MKDSKGNTVFRNGGIPTITTFDNNGGVYLPLTIEYNFIGVSMRAEMITEKTYYKEGATYYLRGQGYRFRDISKYSKSGGRLSKRSYVYMQNEDISDMLNDTLITIGFSPRNRK